MQVLFFFSLVPAFPVGWIFFFFFFFDGWGRSGEFTKINSTAPRIVVADQAINPSRLRSMKIFYM